MSKLINVRLPDALAEQLEARMAERQVTVTSAVVNALWEWVHEYPPMSPEVEHAYWLWRRLVDMEGG